MFHRVQCKVCTVAHISWNLIKATKDIAGIFFESESTTKTWKSKERNRKAAVYLYALCGEVFITIYIH